jgi:TonB family protein
MSGQTDAELATRISCLSEITDLQSAIAAEELDCDAALNLITRRMMELTRASGAAIALREGQDVVCRASAGNAPDVGVRLSPTSLSGQCFQTGAIVMLEDSENDPRVNPELCRQLNFRSLLVLPIPSGREIIGIAEVLSPEARNFAGGDILVLSFLADLIATVALPRIEPDRNAVPEPVRLPIFDEFAPPTVTEPSVSLSLSPLELPEVLPSPEIPVVPATRVETEQIASPAAVENSAQVVELEPVGAPITSAANAVAAKTALRFPESRAAAPDEFAPRSPMSRLVPVIITLVVLLATTAMLAGYYLSRSSKSTKPTSAPATAPSSAPATAAALPAVSLPHQVDSSAVLPAHPQAKPASGSSQRPVAKSDNAPEALVPAELQVIHSASPRPAVTSDNPAPEAPTIAASASRGIGALPTSVTVPKMEAPQLQAPPSQGVTEGKLLKKVLPRYPDMARAAGVSGDVVLSARIATDGTLHDLKVISGSPLLRSPAIEAAKQWRYSPYKLGGTPVETETRITISFHR